MEVILRIALDDSSGKWCGGTVLAAHDLKDKDMFGPGDKGCFLLIQAKTGQFTLEKMRAWRRFKKIEFIKTEISAESISARVVQKETVHTALRAGTKVIPKSMITIQPRFDKVVNLDLGGVVVDAPENQWPVEPEEPEMGEQIPKGKI